MELLEIKNLLRQIKDGYKPSEEEYHNIIQMLRNDYCYEIWKEVIAYPKFESISLYLKDIDCPNEKFLVNNYNLNYTEQTKILIDVFEKLLEIYGTKESND